MSPDALLAVAEQRMMRHDFGGAEANVSTVLASEPNHVRALCFSAIIAIETGRRDYALRAIEKALKIAPAMPGVLNNAALIYFQCGEASRAVEMWQRVLQLMPHSVDAAYNMALYCSSVGNTDQAEDYFRQVLKLAPHHPHVYVNLGNMVKNAGRVEEAIAIFREGAKRHPHDMRALSNLLYAMYFAPGSGQKGIFEASESWGRRFEAGIEANTSFFNERSPERRLRVGYVSGDFCSHAESFFVVPLLESHHPSQVEIHCYASVRHEDEVTKRLKQRADSWHNVLGADDAAVAAQIRQDGIDVLVDLTMHMQGSRLGVFARKPAPVQVTWLAYPGTTGLRRIDYRLTDRFLDPDGNEAAIYTEKSVKLPGCWICYDPLSQLPPVSLRDLAGGICFGSLNNPCKMNEAVLKTWAQVLKMTDGSRLLVMSYSASQKKKICEIMQAGGVESDRLEFFPYLSREDYLRAYDRIDIGLDTLPYNGITTTCDALWMGVPVVSMKGDTASGRVGWGILASVGLEDLVAENPSEFVRIAVELAQDKSRLRALRAGLRKRMHDSPIMDAKGFARGVEEAYRAMWLKWCARV